VSNFLEIQSTGCNTNAKVNDLGLIELPMIAILKQIDLSYSNASSLVSIDKGVKLDERL
jgi:hypothetical protein